MMFQIFFVALKLFRQDSSWHLLDNLPFFFMSLIRFYINYLDRIVFESIIGVIKNIDFSSFLWSYHLLELIFMHFRIRKSSLDFTFHNDCTFLLRTWKSIDHLSFLGKTEDINPWSLITRDRPKKDVAIRIEKDRLSLDEAFVPSGNDKLIVDSEKHASSIRYPIPFRELPLVLPIPKIHNKISIVFNVLFF